MKWLNSVREFVQTSCDQVLRLLAGIGVHGWMTEHIPLGRAVDFQGNTPEIR
jgi:hypothetical protein